MPKKSSASKKGKSIAWHSPGEVCQEFVKSHARRSFILGPFGSGKSVASVIKMLMLAKEQEPSPSGYRKTRWAVIRNTYPELRLTTLKTYFEWIPKEWGTFRNTPPFEHHINVRLPDGTWLDMEVIFLALDRSDDVSKLLSLELTGVWFNEVREIPKSIVDAADARVGRFPSKVDGGPTWHGVIADSNMADQDHWLYKLSNVDRPDGWEFFRQPGGLILKDKEWIPNPKAENLNNLPKGYYTDGKSGKDEDWVKVFFAAQWGYVQEGKPVFPNFNDVLHVSKQIIRPDPNLGLYVGMDFGLTPAAIFGQRTPRGRWNIVGELVIEDMGAVRFAEEIARLLASTYRGFTTHKIVGDPAGDQRSQTDEQTYFDILHAKGIMAQPAPSNDWTLRYEAVDGCLSRLIDGDSAFIISPECHILTTALKGGYCYRRVYNHGKEHYTSIPDKNKFSHPADALQYLLLGAGEGRNITLPRGAMPKPVTRKPKWDVWNT